MSGVKQRTASAAASAAGSRPTSTGPVKDPAPSNVKDTKDTSTAKDTGAGTATAGTVAGGNADVSCSVITSTLRHLTSCVVYVSLHCTEVSCLIVWFHCSDGHADKSALYVTIRKTDLASVEKKRN